MSVYAFILCLCCPRSPTVCEKNDGTEEKRPGPSKGCTAIGKRGKFSLIHSTAFQLYIFLEQKCCFSSVSSLFYHSTDWYNINVPYVQFRVYTLCLLFIQLLSKSSPVAESQISDCEIVQGQKI
jgi:hypothetical protein